ncbi:translation initiation factor IF-3 [Candidatus Omnitrophota bacterium]
MQKRQRINDQIRISEIRVVGLEGEQLGLMSPQDALKIAKDAGVDLVEIAPMAKPPVCRIMDHSKFKYDQEKKEKEARKRQHIIRMKEVRFKPRIDEHDYQTKLNHIKEFISKGNKVKVSLMFRGRELAHTEIGQKVMQRVMKDIVGVGEVDKMPSREGRFLNMVLTPR